MARSIGSVKAGPAIASIRGGSTPLGGSRVILGTISKEGLVSSPVQTFSNPRGEQFSNFLRSVKGSDGGASPLFPHQNLSAKQTEAIKGATPSVNTEPVKSQTPGSVKNKPSVVWFGPPLQNIVPERAGEIGQPQVVEKSISFSKFKSEPALVNPVDSGVNAIKIQREVSQSKFENGAAVEPVVKQIVQTRRQLSIVEQVNLTMMVRKARAAIARPKSQAIPMAGVDAEAAPASAVLPETQTAPTGQSSEIRTTSSEIKAVPENKTRRIVRKTKNAAKESDRLSPDRFRTRFVERDLEMNAWRLKALIKGFDELQQENSGGDVEGAALAAKSHIGSSRELRSVFLDQRGYRDRQDGSQKRMELFLSSVSLINKEQLKAMVKTHTAVKETYEKPREMATVREVNDVVNEPKSLDTRFEPVEISEIVEESVAQRFEVINGKNKELTPAGIDENRPSEPEVDEERGIQPTGIEMPLKLSNMASIRHDLEGILGWQRLPLSFQRRELVLN